MCILPEIKSARCIILSSTINVPASSVYIGVYTRNIKVEESIDNRSYFINEKLVCRRFIGWFNLQRSSRLWRCFHCLQDMSLHSWGIHIQSFFRWPLNKRLLSYKTQIIVRADICFRQRVDLTIIMQLPSIEIYIRVCFTSVVYTFKSSMARVWGVPLQGGADVYIYTVSV